MKFKKGDTVIYPQHGACKVEAIRKEDPLNTGKLQEYLVLRTVIGDMTLRVPMSKVDEVGVRPPVSPDELEDLVAVLAKADPRAQQLEPSLQEPPRKAQEWRRVPSGRSGS